MSKRLVIGVAILTSFIVILVVWIIDPLTQTPAPQSQSLYSQEIIDACKDFEGLEHPIGCHHAASVALGQAQGNIQKISIDNVATSVPTSDTIEIQTVEMWLIDIRLTTPYFDEEFNKEIKVLQIGTPTKEEFVQYQKPLE